MLRYGGKSMEELGSILKEKNVSLSILAPRKIPSLYNIFDKAGGDLLQVSHLVDLPASVGDPDPHVFGPPGSGSISQRFGSGYRSGSVSFPFLPKMC
jgi:hypothetical protein